MPTCILQGFRVLRNKASYTAYLLSWPFLYLDVAKSFSRDCIGCIVSRWLLKQILRRRRRRKKGRPGDPTFWKLRKFGKFVFLFLVSALLWVKNIKSTTKYWQLTSWRPLTGETTCTYWLVQLHVCTLQQNKQFYRLNASRELMVNILSINFIYV